MPSVPWPPEFDAAFYVARYPDLSSMTAAEAASHFAVFGAKEGRLASPAALRGGFTTLIPSSASVLEIGPGHSPTFRGPKVAYFDVVDAEGLRLRAVHWKQPSDGVPAHIDFVSSRSDMSIIPAERFDFVFSSHAIEHQPDLISHLRAVARVLKPNGSYLVICPDRRYCFDRHIRPTSVGDVIEAFVARREKHRLADVIDAHALPVHNDVARHWRENAPEPTCDPSLIREALKAWEAQEYVDVHAWRLTPSSARKILGVLYAMGYFPLRPARIYDTPHDCGEFCMVFSR